MENPEETRNEQSAEDGSSDETSNKTLADIEDEQKDSGATDGDHGSAPSPDGQFDESTPGPM